MWQLSEGDAWGSPFPSEVDRAALIESEDNWLHISLKDAWSVPFPSAAEAAPASGEHHQRKRSGVVERDGGWEPGVIEGVMKGWIIRV